MKRQHLGIRPGDYLRCPDAATARWHRVLRVGRRRDGTHYVVLQRGRFWRILGLPRRHLMEWAVLSSLGFGIRRATPRVQGSLPSERTDTEGALRTDRPAGVSLEPKP